MNDRQLSEINSQIRIKSQKSLAFIKNWFNLAISLCRFKYYYMSKRPLKILFLFGILNSTCFITKAQGNLVPNNSFEDTVSAPLGGVIDDATGWINCYLSPDYYNPAFDSDGFGFGVPNCYYTGYQNAFDGNSFAGIGLTIIPEQPGEFFGIQLTSPLTVGTKYYVSAYISQANFYPCSSNNFCFKFFNSLYFLPSFSNPPIDNFAHVTSSIRVTDTLGWQLVGGAFIADSSYQYLVIGNFYNLAQTDTSNCYANPDGSYYYVDDVCVSSDSATCMVPTSIQNFSLKKNQISIYPNPASDFIHIKSSSGPFAYSLVNSLGITVDTGKLNSENEILNVSLLSAGLYFLRIDKSSFKIVINN